MKIECVSSLDYRQNKSGWKYTLNKPASFLLAGREIADWKCVFLHGSNAIGELHNGILTIYSNYAWNGMSFWEDNESTMRASLFHDFCYQVGNYFLPRQCADALFYQLLIRNRYALAAICYLAVKGCGWMFYFSDPKYIKVKPIPELTK